MPDKPAILHVVSLSGVGGVETSFLSVLDSNALIELNQIALVSCSESSPNYQFCRRNTDRVVRMVRLSGARPFAKYKARILAWLRATRRIHPEVIIFWNSIPSIAWFVLVRTRFPQSRILYYERGRAWMLRPNFGKRFVLGRMNGVLCNSRAAQRILEDRWGVVADVHVLRNPIPEQYTAPQVTTRTLRIKGPFRIGVAGRLISVKGVALAIHALRELARRGLNCELVVAGDGPLRDSLSRLAKQLGVSVAWLGLQQDMPRFYCHIDVLLVPSIREPFGLISIEAQSWGVPVVVSRIDGLPETIVDGVTGYSVPMTLSIDDAIRLGCDVTDLPDVVYDPVLDQLCTPMAASPVDLADATITLLRDRDRYAEMSHCASRHALLSFSFTKYAAELKDVLMQSQPGTAK